MTPRKHPKQTPKPAARGREKATPRRKSAAKTPVKKTVPPQAAKGEPRRGIKPSALSIAELAKVLEQAGGRIEGSLEERLRTHLAAGAPTNADGTINLIHYTAWLVKETT